MNHDENNSAAFTSGPHFGSDDLLLYVLEMLTPEQRQAIGDHLPTCEDCRQDLEAVQEEIGVFAVASVGMAGVEAVTPPASSRTRLLAELGKAELISNPVPDSISAPTSAQAATPAATPAPSPVATPAPSAAPTPAAAPAPKASPTPASTTPTPAPTLGVVAGSKPPARKGNPASQITTWIGWGIAASLAFAAMRLYQNQQLLEQDLADQTRQIAQLQGDAARAHEILSALTDSSAQRATLTLTKAAAPPQPSGRATYLADKGTLILLASHLQQLPAGKTYELWVIPASGAAPVPAGTFRPDARGNANVVTAKLEGAGAAKAFGITIEPEGGSTTPTMPIVLAGS